MEFDKSSLSDKLFISNEMRSTFHIRLLLVSAALLASTCRLSGQSAEDCLACHENKELTMEKKGKSVSLYVDAKAYKASTHGSQDCVACHAGFDPSSVPHAPAIKPVDCTSCHEAGNVARSAHGLARAGGKKNAPDCAGCHTAHAIQPAAKMKFAVDLCLRCHTSPSVAQFKASRHYLARGTKSVPTCTTCHGAAHDILPGSSPASPVSRKNTIAICEKCHAANAKAFGNSIHSTVMKSGIGRAPLCTDCHGAHSASANKYTIESKGCLNCHLNRKIFEKIPGKENLVSFVEKYQSSVHAQVRKDGRESATCSDCHGNHMIMEGKNSASQTTRKNLPVTCGRCHADIAREYAASNHGQALARGVKDAPTCTDCHGEHSVQSISNAKNPLSRANEETVCLRCHLDDPQVRNRVGLSTTFIKAYDQSVHAVALKKGNQNAPTCSNCHGSHSMRKGSDPLSLVNKSRVARTCGAAGCHPEAASEYLGSIHGVALRNGRFDSPSCTDCHGQHQILKVDDARAAVSAANLSAETCARCHSSVVMSEKYGLPSGRTSSYMNSYHGLATRGGSKEAANCASCHGVHNIRASSDPASTIYRDNIAHTCGKCHPNANENFTKGKIHVTAEKSDNALIYWITTIYLSLIAVTIGGMFLHNLLDFFTKSKRKIRDRRRAILHHAGPSLYLRMSLFERIQHGGLLVSFITLVLTGFMLKFPDAWWVIHIREFGGDFAFNARSLLHRIAAVLMITTSLVHAWYIAFDPRGRTLVRDLFPRLQDAKDALEALKFYFGLRQERPLFDRFSYIEKAEYWALIWGTFVMVATGFILWFNTTFMNWTSKLFVDVAETIHYYEAWLATLAIIVWHFYFIIFNPDVYPMNVAWLKGTLTEAEMEEEHPLELARLKSGAADLVIDVANNAKPL